MSSRKDNVIACPDCGREIRRYNLIRHLEACRRGKPLPPKERITDLGEIAARRFGGEL
jgi:hypothetical protein